MKRLDFKPCPGYLVPCSELALSMGIADLEVTAYAIDGNSAAVTVAGKGPLPYYGLVSEVIPFELRQS